MSQLHPPHTPPQSPLAHLFIDGALVHVHLWLFLSSCFIHSLIDAVPLPCSRAVRSPAFFFWLALSRKVLYMHALAPTLFPLVFFSLLRLHSHS